MWLVLPLGVQGELAEDLSGGLGHDGDLAVLNDQNDVGSGVGSADADVEELAVVAQREPSQVLGRFYAGSGSGLRAA